MPKKVIYDHTMFISQEGISLVQPAPQGMKPSSKGSAFQQDVSIDKVGLDLANFRPSTQYIPTSMVCWRRGPCGHRVILGQKPTSGQHLSPHPVSSNAKMLQNYSAVLWPAY